MISQSLAVLLDFFSTSNCLLSHWFQIIQWERRVTSRLLKLIFDNSNMFLPHFLDWPRGPKRHRFHWDPEEGQSHSLPRRERAVTWRLHAFWHQQPRETRRASQQLQGSTSAERTTDDWKTTPPLFSHPCPQKQVQCRCSYAQSWTVVVSLSLFYLCFLLFCYMLNQRDNSSEQYSCLMGFRLWLGIKTWA